MVAHDVADTAYLIDQATQLSKDQWTEEISPGQVILDWDGPEPSVGAVLGAIVWTKEVWLATIEGRDFQAERPPNRVYISAATGHPSRRSRKPMGRNGVRVRGRRAAGRHRHRCLVRPAESFQLYGIVAHVLTYSAHRRELARAMLARHGLRVGRGDPLDWMRGN